MRYRSRALMIALLSALSLIALLATAVTVQSWRFRRGVEAAARALFALRGEGAPRVSTEGLPDAVRRWADAAGASRRAPIRSMRLLHRGTFRLEAGKPAVPIRGEQYFSAEVPGFVWWGRVRMGPGLWVEARDSSLAGAGNMLIRIESTFTLDDARGPHLDTAALLRLLAEMAWYPTSLLDPRYVRWTAIDGASARAVLRVGGREVEGTFHFGPDGLIARMETLRPFDAQGKQALPWLCEYSDYREVEGVKVPFRGVASWALDGGRFDYAIWEMERYEFDRPEPF